jgi:hypothetical protein
MKAIEFGATTAPAPGTEAGRSLEVRRVLFVYPCTGSCYVSWTHTIQLLVREKMRHMEAETVSLREQFKTSEAKNQELQVLICQIMCQIMLSDFCVVIERLGFADEISKYRCGAATVDINARGGYKQCQGFVP